MDYKKNHFNSNSAQRENKEEMQEERKRTRTRQRGNGSANAYTGRGNGSANAYTGRGSNSDGRGSNSSGGNSRENHSVAHGGERNQVRNAFGGRQTRPIKNQISDDENETLWSSAILPSEETVSKLASTTTEYFGYAVDYISSSMTSANNDADSNSKKKNNDNDDYDQNQVEEQSYRMGERSSGRSSGRPPCRASEKYYSDRKRSYRRDQSEGNYESGSRGSNPPMSSPSPRRDRKDRRETPTRRINNGNENEDFGISSISISNEKPAERLPSSSRSSPSSPTSHHVHDNNRTIGKSSTHKDSSNSSTSKWMAPPPGWASTAAIQ